MNGKCNLWRKLNQPVIHYCTNTVKVEIWQTNLSHMIDIIDSNRTSRFPAYMFYYLFIFSLLILNS